MTKITTIKKFFISCEEIEQHIAMNKINDAGWYWVDDNENA